MTRLIYAEMLKEAWRKKHNIKEGDCGAVFTGYSEIPRLIDEQPTVDAVEVVRCKDCKYKKEYRGGDICDRFKGTVWIADNDFCSFAER